MAIHDAQFVAPPLAWLMWTGDGAHAGWLTTPATTGAAFDLLDTSAAPCVRDGTERIRWNGARPVQVALRWVVDGKVHSAQVPVIDEHGGIAAAPARVLSLEQASWELLNFPARPAEDDPGIIDCPGMPDEQCDDSLAQAGRKSALQYPIRLMMQQLDTIADIQCNVDRLDWRMWCNRLEQVWCRASNSAGVTAFRTLGIDPLSAMLAPAFRPVYAESAGSVEGQRYEATLARIAVAWKVNDLANLGHDA